MDDNDRIVSISVVDAESITQGHKDLVEISKPYVADSSKREWVTNSHLRSDERFYESENSYLLSTPVMGSGKPVGTVHLEYSKEDLYADIARAFRLTLSIAAAVLVLAILVSVANFDRISRPLRLMMEGVERLGGGNLETRIDMPTRNEFSVLAASFNDMSTRIAAAQKDLIAKERVDRELEIAADIQQALIPAGVRPPPGYEIGHFYQAANEVGGDYLDIIPIDPSRIGFVMADVSGKGIPGLVVMAMVKILVQEFVVSGTSPAQIVRRLNQTLQGNIKSNMFVTFFVAILDIRTGRLTFSNAGHNPLLIYNSEANNARFFRMEGMPLGVFDGGVFDTSIKDYQIELQPGDVVLQYTDGLNESRNEAGKFFSTQRILDIAGSHGHRGANEMVRRLVAEETQFRGGTEQFDDITLLTIGSSISVPARQGGVEV
jgi:sigma-B regulation protein RsbU (phosphoserine phosphatase)